MLDVDSEAVLVRLLEMTKSGHLLWSSDEDEDFVAVIPGSSDRVVIQRIWVEAVGRPGAEPYQLELRMPCWSVRYPISGDSPGCRYLCAILDAAGLPIVAVAGSPSEALRHLTRPQDG
jgi:hypothetical protein